MSEKCLDVYVGKNNYGYPIFSIIYDGKFIKGSRMVVGKKCIYWADAGNRITDEMKKIGVSRYNVVNNGKFELGNNKGSMPVTMITHDDLEALTKSLDYKLSEL